MTDQFHIKVGYDLEAEPPMHMRVSNIKVSMIPLDHPDSMHFTIDVAWRGKDRWAVVREPRGCLGRDGEWDYEPLPSNREDDWLEEHRFTRDEAIALAIKHAPLLTAGGWSVPDILAKIEEDRARESEADIPSDARSDGKDTPSP